MVKAIRRSIIGQWAANPLQCRIYELIQFISSVTLEFLENKNGPVKLVWWNWPNSIREDITIKIGWPENSIRWSRLFDKPACEEFGNRENGRIAASKEKELAKLMTGSKLAASLNIIWDGIVFNDFCSVFVSVPIMPFAK